MKSLKKNEFNYRVNEEIRNYDKVRIVGNDIESSVVPLHVARKIAAEKEMDLVEINSNVNPPIIRICHYEKFIYQLKKNKKNNKPTSQTKEIQLSVSIAKHDLETKANQAKRFIEQGDKVKVTLTMRGRELNRREENKKSLLEFLVMMEDYAAIESMRDETNKTIAILKTRNNKN